MNKICHYKNENWYYKVYIFIIHYHPTQYSYTYLTLPNKVLLLLKH